MLDLRTIALGSAHLKETAGRIWRILRALFQEVVGFLFLVFAGWGGLWLIRNVRQENLFKMVLVGIFVVTMGSFGVSSFRRARRISRAK